MDEKFEQFAKALRGKRPKQIRALAESEGYDLPNFQDADSLIHALYQAREKVSPPAAVHETASVVPSSDDQPPAAGEPTLIRTVSCFTTHWRCGRHWAAGKSKVAESEFTADEWKLLEADPQLKVK